MIVVDANIIVYSLIEGDRTEVVLKARNRDPDWVVPGLWRHEFLNVLSTFTRKRMLVLSQAEDIWKNAVRMFHKNEHPFDYLSALRLSFESNISAYDAQYIVLAKRLGVRCMTEDSALLRKFPGLTASAEEVIRKR